MLRTLTMKKTLKKVENAFDKLQMCAKLKTRCVTSLVMRWMIRIREDLMFLENLNSANGPSRDHFGEEKLRGLRFGI